MKKHTYLDFKYLYIFFILTSPIVVKSQPIEDTLFVLPLEQYVQWVLRNHPVAQRAGLLGDQAEAGLRIARGGFDPKWYGEWQYKSFDGKNYYNIGESGIKVPTRIGWEIKGAYQFARGTYLNPENTLPKNGQALIGMKIPLLQGMLTDERRTLLAQARLLPEMNEAQRRNSLNELLQEAVKAYLDWSLAFSQSEIARQAGEIARIRLYGLRESFLAGDKPAIDTLETFIQLQNRLLELNEARLLFQNSRLALSNFLWGEDDSPLQLGQGAIPQEVQVLSSSDLPVPDRDTLFQQLLSGHPALQSYQLKQEQLELDRRLQKEMLKPRLDLEYNLLGDGFDLGGPGGDPVVENLLFENYKVGLSAEFPLFLRKERGKLELADLKLLDNNYSFEQKQLELGNKLQSYLNELTTLREQIALYESVAANYQALLDAESAKFRIGESSIFLLNSRENNLIEARLKLAELKAKFLKAYYQVWWAAGLLPGI